MWGGAFNVAPIAIFMTTMFLSAALGRMQREEIATRDSCEVTPVERTL